MEFIKSALWYVKIFLIFVGIILAFGVIGSITGRPNIILAVAILLGLYFLIYNNAQKEDIVKKTHPTLTISKAHTSIMHPNGFEQEISTIPEKYKKE